MAKGKSINNGIHSLGFHKVRTRDKLRFEAPVRSRLSDPYLSPPTNIARVQTTRRMADDDFLCPKCKSPVLFRLNKVPSPVPCIFHSNEPPTRLESKLIHETLHEADHQISTIDADIAQIPATMEKLRIRRKALVNRREALVNHRTAHSTLLSPLRRLPPELLSEVFIHLSRSTHTRSPFVEGPTPWNLSQVCRRWRNVALSTPALWSSLDLDYPYSLRDPGLTVEAVSTWLSRSGQLMLFLSISFPESTPVSSLRRLFELIAAFSHRLEFLEVSAAWPTMRTLFSMIHGLPRLEQLSLTMNTDPELDEETVVIVAPKLTTASISWFPLLRFLLLPWSQLTELDTFHTDVMTCLSIIASSPSLQSYSFHPSSYDPMPLPSLSTPIISNIRSLSLEIIDPEWAICLLSNLTLPLLSEFEVDYTSDYTEQFGLGFEDLAERSQFPLKKLVATCTARDECGCYCILSNLASVSKLEELELCFRGATMEDMKDFLGRLMDGSSHSTMTHPRLSGEASLPALPRLRAITGITPRSLSEEAISMLVDMVSSPWQVEVVREYNKRSITLRRS